LLCNLGGGEFFSNNIHRANYHFTHSKKLKTPDNTTVLPLGGIVYSKRPRGESVRRLFLLHTTHFQPVVQEKFQNMTPNSTTSRGLTPNSSTFQELTRIASRSGTLLIFPLHALVNGPKYPSSSSSTSLLAEFLL
jgi:hypothetical protein